jgi:hypothetical protein
VLTAVLWMSDMRSPYTVVATVLEAEVWCAEQLRKNGMALPGRDRATG